MNDSLLGSLIVLMVVLVLGGTFTMAVLESLHEWRMEELQYDCRPRVCRTEHGHTKECDNEESNR